MKVLFIVCIFVQASLSGLVKNDIELDPEDELSFEDFEKEFGEVIDDPEEKAKRKDALEKAEEDVKEVNREFLEGEKEWFEKIDEYSDLPEDEFEAERTGSIDQLGRGLLHRDSKLIDLRSEKYFDKFRFSRSDAPTSYNSIDLGYVTEVKNQMTCGSCVAFASMAAIEVCFKKLTGLEGDYSEQQLVDCGYGDGAWACSGAFFEAYLKQVGAKSVHDLTHESLYPYLNKEPKLTCPDVEPYYQGAHVTETYHTEDGTEELMEKLVAEHGAVVTTVAAGDEFKLYSGGVFAGCTSNQTNHAVTVVGYGTSGAGEKYWIVKNSWSSDWGDGGYIKIKRGVGMCGIGKEIATVSCEKTDGSTSAPLTTEKPCEDKFTICPEWAEKNCHEYGDRCPKSCGLCEGMTPHASNTCYDQWPDCPKLAEVNCHRYGASCKKSCGLCEGMTPHVTNSCWDTTAECKEWAKTRCHMGSMADNCCLSCGLGEGMTPAESYTCYDKYSLCASMPHLCQYLPGYCKKSCGKC